MIKIIPSVLLVFISISVKAQWVIQPSGTVENLNEIYFPAADTGFVAGENGTVLKTTNGGINWNSLSTGLDLHFHELYFLNTSEGWIVGDSGAVCRTNDGGTNWSCSFTDSAEYINLHSVYAANSNDLWIGGRSFSTANGYLSKSTDGGATWQRASLEEYIWDIDITKIGFTDVLTGYATTRGYVLKTTDGGLNWFITDTASVHAGTMFVLLEDLAFFPGSDTVYTCGWYGPYLGKTVNGAASWSHDATLQNYNLDFMNTQTGYVAGWCQVHKTTDGGTTFVDASGGGSSLFCNIYSLDFTDEWTGYACGYAGTILKTTNGGATNVHNQNANSVSLVCYPNPAGKEITITSRLLKTAANVSVYDATGKLVFEKTVSQPGPQLKLQVDDLTAGLYFIRLQNGNNTETGKFSVIKNQ